MKADVIRFTALDIFLLSVDRVRLQIYRKDEITVFLDMSIVRYSKEQSFGN
jgi:hypothetical protein